MKRVPRIRRSASAVLEPLEDRTLLSALTVAAVRAAYGFDQTSLDGAGQTIAIVDAYDDPSIAADLDVFDQANGLSSYGTAASLLTKHKMSPAVKADGGWAQEIALDVEWAHAIAPAAKIVLVEAASAGMTDLLAAVDYARSLAGVSVVSMSWGGSEFSSETSFDSHFTTPAGHSGVTFVAAAGDAGGRTTYPAVSHNVISVGGTTLTVANNAYAGERAWSDSGGGTSLVETAALGQAALSGTTRRATPDVAYDADPATGFFVYDSYTYQGDSGWLIFGGTSAGAPQWGGLVALANQGRAAAGKAALDGATQTLPALYAAPASDFHDVISGATSRSISAKAGYDLATGRGSPVAPALIADLVNYAGAASASPVTATRAARVSRTARRPISGLRGKLPVVPAATSSAGDRDVARGVLHGDGHGGIFV